MTPDKAWKSTERAVARILEGQRAGPRGAHPDVEHAWLAPEVKHRAKTPAWLQDAVAQSVRNSPGADHLPLVVLHESGQRHSEDLVIMRLADFVDWFGGESGLYTRMPRG